MTTFTRIEKAQGGNLYKNVTEDKTVEAETLAPALKEELDLADPGTEIDEDTVTQGAGDGVEGKGAKGTDDEETARKSGEEEGNGEKPATPAASQSGAASAQKAVQKANNEVKKEDEGEGEKPAETANPYTKPVPQSSPGMGFPRVNGKTVDFFDGETPHTHIRAVAGFTVPLSAKNYNEKTDTEIYKKLVDDGYVS